MPGYGVAAGTDPVTERTKYGSQKSQADSRSRVDATIGASRRRYLSAPRPFPVGCVTAGQDGSIASWFGVPRAANVAQYSVIALESPTSSLTSWNAGKSGGPKLITGWARPKLPCELS
jgi:hypothetical protein